VLIARHVLQRAFLTCRHHVCYTFGWSCCRLLWAVASHQASCTRGVVCAGAGAVQLKGHRLMQAEATVPAFDSALLGCGSLPCIFHSRCHLALILITTHIHPPSTYAGVECAHTMRSSFIHSASCRSLCHLALLWAAASHQAKG
jgi:hypothetical protein